jgi:hypothetical protein
MTLLPAQTITVVQLVKVRRWTMNEHILNRPFPFKLQALNNDRTHVYPWQAERYLFSSVKDGMKAMPTLWLAALHAQ